MRYCVNAITGLFVGILVGIAIGYFIPRGSNYTYIETTHPNRAGLRCVLVMDNKTGELVRTIGREDMAKQLEEKPGE